MLDLNTIVNVDDRKTQCLKSRTHVFLMSTLSTNCTCNVYTRIACQLRLDGEQNKQLFAY